jgi:beta-N-acetylhexosaminidase
MTAGGLVFAGIPGTSLDAAATGLLMRWRPGGVVLFARNLETFEQTSALVAGLRRLLPGAVLAIDAEGGRVDRLRGLLGPSPPGDLLARLPPAAAQRAGRWMGRALRLLDLDLDFAPVVDLDRGAADNALGSRYLGATAAAVTPRAAAFLNGLAAAGVGGCLKHFPGLGEAVEDTHLRTAAVGLDAQQLAEHVAPFRALAPAAGAVMVAHAVYRGLDPLERPASLSPPVIGGLLRGDLGFDGLCLSDDLEMKALDEWGDLAVRAEASFAAGCDAVLACSQLDALPEIAARLAAPRHAGRRAEAARRFAAFRRHLDALRERSDDAPPSAEGDAAERLEGLRAGRAALLVDLLGEEG